MAGPRDALVVKNFAQIHEARIEFGDLTVLVGPQATGKSLVLQLFKLMLDARYVSQHLRDTGQLGRRRRGDFFGIALGEGAGRYPLRDVGLELTLKRRHPTEAMFYIPAQRALLLADGWPSRLERTDERMPLVARLFSDSLHQLLSTRRVRDLVPGRRRLGSTLAKLIDQAILHGGRVGLHEGGNASNLEMLIGTWRDGIHFSAWSTGQREFVPLLLGVYHVLLSKDLQWVVIEEPEMGLHPRGIEVAMLLVLDLLRRGLKVVISTHSPVVLEVIWGIQRLMERGARPSHVLELFGLRGQKDLLPLAKRALAASYRVYALNYEGKGVVSRDISGLDPSSESSAEAFWGGLTEFSTRVSDMVTRLSR